MERRLQFYAKKERKTTKSFGKVANYLLGDIVIMNY